VSLLSLQGGIRSFLNPVGVSFPVADEAIQDFLFASQ
jgi:hypothetical protein